LTLALYYCRMDWSLFCKIIFEMKWNSKVLCTEGNNIFSYLMVALHVDRYISALFAQSLFLLFKVSIYTAYNTYIFVCSLNPFVILYFYYFVMKLSATLNLYKEYPEYRIFTKENVSEFLYIVCDADVCICSIWDALVFELNFPF